MDRPSSLLLTLTALLALPWFVTAATGKSASCDLIPTENFASVSGTIRFTEDGDSIKVTGVITNLSASEHGFHVHTRGKTTNNCLDAGSHFNPFHQVHGGPGDTIRHVGDLGNIVSDGSKSEVDITDGIIKFSGDANIIGKALVVHEGRDDLGKGTGEESKKTGNAGARVACCVIREVGTSAGVTSAVTPWLLLILSVVATLVTWSTH